MNVEWNPALAEQFDTGAIRESKQGKGRYDLLPPYALFRIALIFEVGGKQKGDRNWEKGIPLWSFFSSAVRHLFQWMSGDRTEDHLGQAAWNILCLIETEEKIGAGALPESLLEALPNSIGGKNESK